MRILKSRRAISGAVTALILVIVSVALALAVAVFAFGLFGSFGNSGQLQITSTPLVNVVKTSTTIGNNPVYSVTVIFNVKNGGATPASLQSIQVAGYLNSTPLVYLGSKQATGGIPAGYAGEVNVTFENTTALPSSLTSPNNVGGSVQINMVFTQGSLSPTFTLQGILNSTNTQK
ncbi:hypothetical protein MetMK1DRAFT_00024010 [Metallosphaera yellowstonensis MK1]|uniref:Archaeal flagellin-like protein n=1 Tax=Metallosphaera yellowstonensis MK1 TaxID=671065 RepID=H2C753_9CREN|nr:hypothetical protein [Metallosphaera yellowstonensis]EHP69630.1 hypothetical protein MetMK1DRAFT_00024010 [Metallosphaera yellowstonensis MK1]